MGDTATLAVKADDTTTTAAQRRHLVAAQLDPHRAD
jgi:hypothetical protein